MRADAHELVHWAQRANCGPVFDCNVASECGGIGHDHMVPDCAIVCDVGIGHDQRMTSDTRQATAFHSAAIDGHELANFVVVSNFELCRFTCITQVLGRHTDRGE